MNVVSGNTYVEHETFTPSSVSSTTWILGWYFLFGLRWSCNILLKTCSSEKRKNAKRIILTYTNFSLIDGRGMIVLWNKISVKNYRPKFNSRILKTAICRGYDSRSKPQTLLSWRIFPFNLRTLNYCLSKMKQSLSKLLLKYQFQSWPEV